MDKQMPSSQLLQQLAQGLQQAGRARDWVQLARVDAELARALPRWSTPAAWGAAERSALQDLRQAHAQAQQLCAAELQDLDQALAQMREGRGRWQAYAESNNWQDEEGQA